MTGHKSILVISDQHFPYNHPDTVSFLKEIKNKYKPDRVINIGDEIDGQSFSFHLHDPDLLSPGDELELAIKKLSALYKIFPKMDLVESNHGSLVYRRGKFAGLPRHVFKNYRDVLGAPRTWHWHDDLIVRASNGHNIYFCHSLGADILKVSQSMGMSVVAGHTHTKFEIRYWQSRSGLFFGMTVGCLIDGPSLAYSYDKVNLHRPVIGTGIILDGFPRLLPMVMDKHNRWTGKLY